MVPDARAFRLLAAGLGGLVGGYWGARLSPRVPERPLQLLLGLVCLLLAVAYVATATR